MYKTILTLFCLSLVFSGFSQALPIKPKDVKKLASIMAGEFSSEAQAKADSAYFHIRLAMKPIWKKKKDGYWLYVEQAVAESAAAPYRQRVYHLYQQDDTTIVSKVYEIKDPARYAGGWKDAAKLATLTSEELIDRQGCSIYLRKNADGTFQGATPEKECLSSLRGAKYATSEVVISPDQLLSWDRGWDANDKQVWGAVKGGYVFRKLGRLK